MSDFLKKVGLFLSGSADYGFPVFGEQSKEVLSNETLANQLLQAIDLDKHGQATNPIKIKNKSYKLVRLGENQVVK